MSNRNPAIRSTLLALAAAAALFAAWPSQAHEGYCPPPDYGYGGHGDYRRDYWDERWDERRDDRRDERWSRGDDGRWDGRRDRGWHEHYAYDHRREDRRARHDGRWDRDRRWY
ncbi:MAG: hypothetical protein NVS9B10_22950 [Nevskia sp.]